ncbi:MAG: guanylate kinase [Flavobacteriia bacterium]|jgi:guanylate kinase|nr:guanylate kinase [Flavobacteriia bacterium]NBV67336.1 guanylate kinase [Flavobacteriia bacterium]NBY39935.1 guanylate kinase [Flavobacteriia bacterium]
MYSENPSNGKCIIVSAPSGAGKTTIVHALMEQISVLSFSISACSRKPRENEKDGEDYFFIGPEEFKKRISEQAFIEWEEVYPEHYYGTLKSEVEKLWKQGKVVVFDVDVVGGLNLKKKFGENALALFIQPPNLTVLGQRLRSRNTETEERVQQRLKKADWEIEQSSNFDHVILNDVLPLAIDKAVKLATHFIAL